jgi:hypothetical protein
MCSCSIGFSLYLGRKKNLLDFALQRVVNLPKQDIEKERPGRKMKPFVGKISNLF